MAAIQQIQNLIAQSQPIPPDLQVAALLEAQQQGLSSNALAGVFGVPESMIGDAVSALGLGGQLSPSLGGTLAPVINTAEQPSNQEKALGLIENLQQANTLVNAGKNIYEGLTTTIPNVTATAPYQSPYAINLGGSDAGVITDPTATFTGGLSTAVGALSGQESTAESAGLAVLGAFNPAAALAYRIFDAMDLFGGGGLQETPMTPEEAATYAAESRLASTLQGQGEGAGELILDAVEQARAANVKPEDIAEALNESDNPVAGLVNLTVGSNQMLSEADLAAAQAAAAQPTTEETVDLTADTTANELLTIGSGDGSLGDAADLGTVSQDPTVDQATVSDVNETWTYNKATDSFISSTRGDSVPNAGNADLKDGGVYAVTPVLGTDGVMAENVVDTETNEPVGVFSIDINTGLPTITKPVDTVGSSGDGDTFNTIGDTLNTGETLTVGDTTGGDTAGDDITNGDTTSGDDFNTATDTNNTGQVLTVGDTTVTDPVVTTPTVATTPTVINGEDGVDGVDGIDGVDGQDGRDGQDGQDGRDGRDGIIGLFSAIQSTPLTDSILFEPKFTELDNIPVGMFERFLQATGGR